MLSKLNNHNFINFCFYQGPDFEWDSETKGKKYILTQFL